MKNLIEALTEIRKFENSLDWGWINDGGEGCQKALEGGYAELVKQPYDGYGQRDFVKLTDKGLQALKKINNEKNRILKTDINEAIQEAVSSISAIQD